MAGDIKLVNIALTDLKLSTLNPRKHLDEAKLKDLVASVKEKGVLQAILVRPSNGKYEIVFGSRRFKAAGLAGLKEIKAEVKELTDKQVLEFQVIENLQREDVHPLEEAEGYEQLLKKHNYKTVEDIAAKVGKSTAYIYGRLKLCELIPENRKFFYDGKFSPSVALLVARIPAHLQKEAGKNVANGGDYGDRQPMSFRDAKEYVHENFMLQLKEAQFDTKEKGLAGKGSCGECPKRTGNQKELFEDVNRADVCTDPSCFEAKKQAFIQRKLAELKKSGKKFLPLDQVENALRYGSNYLKLGDTCCQAGAQGKRPTYRDLTKKVKDAEIIYAVHPKEGILVELITKPEAARILKKLGVKDESQETKTRGEKVGEHKKEERITAAKRAFWIEKIMKNMDQRIRDIMLLSILSHDAGIDDHDDKILQGIDMMEDDFDDIYKLGDAKIKEVINRILYYKPHALEDHNLEFLATKLGFSMAKDYVITKEYLGACTIEELNKLAHELNISDRTIGGGKSALVAHIFNHAPKGKVPKELLK